MTLLEIHESAARARLNQIGHPGGTRELATALVRWQHARASEDAGALLVPIAIPLPQGKGNASAADTVLVSSVGTSGICTAHFRSRARVIREQIAERLGLTDEMLIDQITVSVRRRPLDGVSAHHQDARPSGMRPPVATESC